MKKTEKTRIIENLTSQLNEADYFYLTDISELNSEATTKLRRLCYGRNIRLLMVKNTLLKKAMENSVKDFSFFNDTLKGNTSIMFPDNFKEPAKLIREFRKDFDKPVLKGAFLFDMHFIGDNQLDNLIAFKTKEELLGYIISLVQAPLINVISALKSGSEKIAGLLKTMSEKDTQ